MIMTPKPAHMARRAVIFDVDNTLYNFVDFFAHAFRAMLHAVAQQTGLSEDELKVAFRRVYAKYQSLEYRFLLQEVPEIVAATGNDPERLERLHRAAIVAFSKSRNKRLKAYEGVEETLQWLCDHRYVLVAYSDGPHEYTRNRLRYLGLWRYFDLLVAWGPLQADLESAPDSAPAADRWRWFADVMPEHRANDAGRIRTVCSRDRKPNPAVLAGILAELGVAPGDAFVVGDSIAKDLVPARAIGATDVFARYGKQFDSESWKTLVEISPWHDAVIRVESDGTVNPFTPSFTINDPRMLCDIVPGARQVSLFA
jgi:phosphoglycolate phosphatase